MDQIDEYASRLDAKLQEICKKLRKELDGRLANGVSRLYHGAPVWFIDENPIVGYSLKKGKIALLFWSGQSFTGSGLAPVGKHKAAEASFGDIGEIHDPSLAGWLAESHVTIWDYKNMPKKKGILELLK